MNFIELNKWNGREGEKTSIHIHTMMISALVGNQEARTTVYLMGGQSFVVFDTVSEIKKKIKEAETFKITTFDPKGSK